MTHCSPSRAPHPLTVPGLAPPPRVLCRWQLKISSARRRYLVIFSLTASRRSLLGSTVGQGGHQGPPALRGWGSGSSHPPPALRCLPCLLMRLVCGLFPRRAGGAPKKGGWGEGLGTVITLRFPHFTAGTHHLAGCHHIPGKNRLGISVSIFRGDISSQRTPICRLGSPVRKGQSTDWAARTTEFTGQCEAQALEVPLAGGGVGSPKPADSCPQRNHPQGSQQQGQPLPQLGNERLNLP